MRHYPKRWLVMILALVLCSVAMAAPLTPRPLTPEKAAQNAILNLASKLDTSEVPVLANKIVNAHDSEDISSVFKLKRRGGLGIGSIAVNENQDGIERLVMLYARRAPTNDDLEKHQDDLLRAANAIRAMSELAPYRIAKLPVRNDNDRKERQRIILEFKTAADEFRTALAEKDPLRVKTAANRLNHTCCDCHSVVDR